MSFIFYAPQAEILYYRSIDILQKLLLQDVREMLKVTGFVENSIPFPFTPQCQEVY
ncbi:MAG: hypothetical protein HWQ43_13880 [Nostoc sp. JL31]|uniref:hypothetical protein n=1 Tax=Nostoc sp. JL31 TaxID=2815395 RepID=UPI0025D76042|nr:hypothetical protein [Nostoc sp. JL31]MBN3890201.1 hypothetical protein [Nostoc sp. JL31]